MDLATFSDNDYTRAILGLIEDEYETLEDGIEAIALATDSHPDDVIDFLDGTEVPNAEVAMLMGLAFDSIQEDEDAALGLALVAENTAAEMLGDEYFEDEDEEYYEDDEENYDDYDEEYYEDDDDEYYEDYDDEYYEDDEDMDEFAEGVISTFAEQEDEINELKEQIALFQAEKVINNELDQIIGFAEELVSEGKMLPIEYEIIYSKLAGFTAEDRLSNFAEQCENSGISAESYMMALNILNEFCDVRGEIIPMGSFTSAAKETSLFSASDDDDEDDEQAAYDVSALLQDPTIFTRDY